MQIVIVETITSQNKLQISQPGFLVSERKGEVLHHNVGSKTASAGDSWGCIVSSVTLSFLVVWSHHPRRTCIESLSISYGRACLFLCIFRLIKYCGVENYSGLRNGSPDVHLGRGDWRNNFFGGWVRETKQWWYQTMLGVGPNFYHCPAQRR